jgi:hypothetical protein
VKGEPKDRVKERVIFWDNSNVFRLLQAIILLCQHVGFFFDDVRCLEFCYVRKSFWKLSHLHGGWLRGGGVGRHTKHKTGGLTSLLLQTRICAFK